MKNYLKIKNLFIVFVVLVVISCSKDDGDSNSSEGGVKYLSTLTGNIGDQSYPRYARKDTLVYENGKVVKACLSAGCNSSVQQYEYGSNGKISKIYRANIDNMGGYPQFSDLINMFESRTLDEYDANPITLNYDAQNRLIGTNSNIMFEYDEQGRIFKIYTGSFVFTVKEFDEKGNPLLVSRNYGGSIRDIVYSYSALKNPYYGLFKEFGLFEINCALSTAFITPNATSSDGDLEFIYSADGEYPLQVTTSYNSVYEFSYR